MLGYYIVYSLRTKDGSGLGRTSITTNRPIDSMRRINDVEEIILNDLRKTTPSAENVFVTFWAPITPSITS